MTEPDDLHFIPDIDKHYGAASRARMAALEAKLRAVMAKAQGIGKAADEESRHSPKSDNQHYQWLADPR